LGFHIPGRYDKVLDIEECFLQKEPSNSIRLFIKEFAIKNRYDFFNLYKTQGFLRNLIIRTSTTGDIMLIVSFFTKDMSKIEALLDAVQNEFPKISSLHYVINPKKNDTITDLEIIHYKGSPFIFEEMEGIRFQIGPKSFYQTNSIQAYNLYKLVRTFGDFNSNDIVYDLYTGTGTIANFIAQYVKKVIGIEYVEESINDAKKNSVLNNIQNTEFFAGDMKDILTDEFIQQHGKPNVIITDPPRAGMHKKVIETIIKTNSDRIIYVSCNAATQARDLELLKDHYKTEITQAVDMFPHTHHTENILLLKRR
jgi:23S rRNA (uracil1939-C5)-methyltransferase